MATLAEVEYDINFCFPVPQKIENTRVALTPFIPVSHGELFHTQAQKYPEIFNRFTFGPFESLMDFNHFAEERVRSNPGYMMFCVWDKTRKHENPRVTVEGSEGAFAGLIGLINSSLEMLATEIGLVFILPPFHRTHVASNAVGLLLHYALELPLPQATIMPPNSVVSSTTSRQDNNIFSVSGCEPLGLRRVAWQADARNSASRRLAERMGFKFEAIQRWGRVYPAGRPGRPISPREGDPKADEEGLDAIMLSVCWDDWEKDVKESVQLAMRRIS